MPGFFIPGTEGEETDRVYATFAAWCRSPVLSLDKRIREIEWTDGDDDWVARVGEHLRGRSVFRSGQQDGWAEMTTPLSDPAAVLAIFAATTFSVVTDAEPIGVIVSSWPNPIRVRRPISVRRFDVNDG